MQRPLGFAKLIWRSISRCHDTHVPRERMMNVQRRKCLLWVCTVVRWRSSVGGCNEVAETFGIACHELASLDFRCGSRLCKNADVETFRATIESGRQRGRIIVAAKASFLIQYFVSVSRKSFLHSLGQNRKSSVGLGSRVEEGRGGGRLPVAMAGAFAAAPQSGLPWPRFPSPLIEPDVRLSRIRLSDWLHRKAHGGRPLQAGVSRRHRGA